MVDSSCQESDIHIWTPCIIWPSRVGKPEMLTMSILAQWCDKIQTCPSDCIMPGGKAASRAHGVHTKHRPKGTWPAGKVPFISFQILLNSEAERGSMGSFMLFLCSKGKRKRVCDAGVPRSLHVLNAKKTSIKSVRQGANDSHVVSWPRLWLRPWDRGNSMPCFLANLQRCIVCQMPRHLSAKQLSLRTSILLKDS